MEQGNNLLENLKDIYLPDRVSAWPVTYGWWLLLGLIILVVVIIFIMLKIRKNIQAKKERQVQNFANEMMVIQQQKPEEFVSELSLYLKRVAVSKFADANVHQLFDYKWPEFLNNQIDSDEFITGIGQLINSRYRKVPLSTEESLELLELAKKWLRAVL